MKLLLAGGGTGGHLFPALAIAQELFRSEPGSEVLFVGTERGLEAKLLPQMQLPLATVDMVGLVGRGWKGRLQLLPKLAKSILQAGKLIDEFQPELVLGVGGYASVPALLAAKWKRVPYLIHEQNAIPGLSNRWLARWAETICLSLPDSGAGLPEDKIRLTGNPLRVGFDQMEPWGEATTELLIFGGSRGAQAINQAVVEMLPLLSEWEEKPFIRHQTGDADLQKVREAYRRYGYERVEVVPFIADMANAYRRAALVVCRAGATTLAELTVCGRPALLIPYPYAAADHQTHNARRLEQAGAARILEQGSLTGETLAAVIAELLADRQQLQQMAEVGRKLGHPGAAQQILMECRRLLSDGTL